MHCVNDADSSQSGEDVGPWVQKQVGRSAFKGKPLMAVGFNSPIRGDLDSASAVPHRGLMGGR